MLRRTLILAAIMLVAVWSLSYAQMMGGNHSMTHGSTADTSTSSCGMGDGDMKHMSAKGNMSQMMSGGMMGQMMNGGMMQGRDIQALMTLGLTDRQIKKLVSIRADLQKDQLPLFRRQHEIQGDHGMHHNAADLTTAQQAQNDEIVKRLDARADKALEKARSIFTDEQLESLGDRSIPMFASGMMQGCMMADGSQSDPGMMKNCKMEGGAHGKMGGKGMTGSGDHAQHHSND